jgi:AAA ATPase domain
MVGRSVTDGVLGYFGYPEAAEDDAEQAVRAGLAVIREVPSIDSRLRGRVGIATGLAIVGGPGVLGEPIEVASRLLALAAPDTLVISASCQRLTGGLFEYEPRPPPAGAFACSERTFRVIGEAPIESRFEALRQRGLTPLFGRAEELALLMCRWEQARSGAGKVILISGEPGIGKSRLIREFRARISEDEYSPLVCSCAPHRQHSAYHPFAEYLERAAGFQHADNDESRHEKLQALLQQSASAPGDTALLADLLSLKTAASIPDLAPRRRRERTIEVLSGHFVTTAKHRPALMVFEDAHWIDPTSREVLDGLVDRVADLPMLLIVTYRPEFVPPWSTRAHVTTVVLNALGRSAAAEMVEQIAGRRHVGGRLWSNRRSGRRGAPVH